MSKLPNWSLSHESRERMSDLLPSAAALGIDPDAVVAGGLTALRALAAIEQASNSTGEAERNRYLARAQTAIDVLNPRKNAAVMQQFQARLLALQGRGEDTEIAHVTPGEVVIPRALQRPDVMAALRGAAARAGVPLNRLRVGARENRVNPRTGAAEFNISDLYKKWNIDPPPQRMEEIAIRAQRAPGPSPRFATPSAPLSPISNRGETGGGLSTGSIPEQLEEITITAQRPSPDLPVSAYRVGSDVVYFYGDGTANARRDGTWTWRNNNPGNINHGDFADDHGAIGQAGAFAVFPDVETGIAALDALLLTPGYQSTTLDGLVEKYAPPKENDTAKYQEFVRNKLKLPGNVALSSLTPEQRSLLKGAIRQFEGWRVGTFPGGPSS
jgi:hypothetical protein